MYLTDFFANPNFIVESNDGKFQRIARKFLPFVKQHLELDSLPKIILLDNPLEGTFGRYQDGVVRVMIAGRHPVDALRTLAHELVHYKQELNKQLNPMSGATGSPEENQANAQAGIIMRDFAQAHPELLKALKEDSDDSGYKQNTHMPSNQELDKVLANCCELVISNQEKDPENHGWVGACVVGTEGQQVYRTSYKKDNGKWVHAEVAALEAYGDITPECIVVTTLSPCNRTMADRAGESCEDVIESYGIGHVYCGYKDPTQDQDNSIETDNAKVKELCKQLADTFLKENFADGKKPGRKGLAKRSGVNTKASVSSLRKTAKNSSGEKARMAHWLANMKAGKKK